MYPRSRTAKLSSRARRVHVHYDIVQRAACPDVPYHASAFLSPALAPRPRRPSATILQPKSVRLDGTGWSSLVSDGT